MLFNNPSEYRQLSHKAVALVGMSGVGKTFAAKKLRAENWFHYSVDYRIGSRYLKEAIEDDLKRIAMQLPQLRDLLCSDSITIRSRLTFDNLTPLAAYLGKPGNPELGGMSFTEYRLRQARHREAEIAATLDALGFQERATQIYGYPNFICDVSGSICEVVDPNDPTDSVLSGLAKTCCFLYIREDDAHTEMLAARFHQDPKPMCYRDQLLAESWPKYLSEKGLQSDSGVVPDDFLRWLFRKAIAKRAPIYRGIAQKWGYETTPEEISAVRDAKDFNMLIETAINRRLEQNMGVVC